ncbi:TRAP transporter fused permease subunit [Rhodovulum sulfidophilum]|uniref:TRAP transporter permease n=1 Tax=Rhodovulum sulfidophilum TaxID=35806 RepID=UPI001924BD9A|nr:TRAP transporter fused permease subunit [Rhodovulum sulfidophilum]MBL3574476.1 TRAP transporter fused permease subunit [Rhodovulum sulfidophilum]MCE8432712.1 TRAP transporter fused permease subunit [Rhodovulum sulfidophilum]MCF4118151.1 TRAP transporter fused permease subunit [Rhodovulum sulfidophilum]
MRKISNFDTWWRALQAVLSVFYVAFLVAQFFHPASPLAAASFHVFMATALVFAWTPLAWEGRARYAARIIDIAGVALSLMVVALYAGEIFRLERRFEMIDPVLPVDILLHVLGLALIFEAVRRSVGWSLLAVVLIFLAYAYLGPWFPSLMQFPGFSLPTQAELIGMKTDGIFGVTASAAINFVFYFVLFGSVFTITGGGQLFIDLAMRATARLKGGAAKMSLVGSALFGMVSGSAIANTTSTGVLTIPIMTRSGYSKEQAAATEAIASTGGQLMPPIMGVAAFVMADMLGIPYITIAAAALIPAAAFYFALYIIVDLRARKSGVGDVAPELLEIPPVIPRLHLLAAPVAMIATLIAGYSAPYAALVGTAIALVAPVLRRSTRYNLSQLFETVLDTARQMAWISAPLAAVGVVMVVATQSNLALKFVSLLSDMGTDNLYLSLLLAIFGCIIMGMGLPTVAAYIIGSLVFVPALMDLGVDRLAANLFVLYYCVLSMVTPPVALCSYAAAGIAKSDANRTGLVAFGYSLVIFLVPFGFIKDPAVLWQGSAFQIATGAAGMLLATFCWAVFLIGWLRGNLSLPERGGFALASLVLVITPTLTAGWVISVTLTCLLLVWRFALRPRLVTA